jgi:hypothetical protein
MNTNNRRRNEVLAKLERVNMKTRNLLITIGAVALTAITINLNASDALLSPRAKGNEIKVVASMANDANPVAANRDTALSPRAAGNKTSTAAGVETVAVKCPVLGSPRQVTAAGKDGRTSCCGLTLAECPTMNDMPKSN